MIEYSYKDITLGMKESFQKKITEEDMGLFAKITGDNNPLHTDDNFAKETKFGKKVVFGLLVNSLLSTLVGMYLPGKHSLILSVESKFKLPCFVNDNLTISGEVINKIDVGKIIVVNAIIKNQNSTILQESKLHVMVLK